MKILKKTKFKTEIDPIVIKDTYLETIYKFKDIGPKLVMFIACVTDLSPDNPYSSLPRTSKVDIIFQRVFKTDKTYNEHFTDEQKAIIDKGSKEYDKLFNIALDKDLSTYDIKMDQLNTMLQTLYPVINKNIHDTTEKVSFSTNIDIINKVLQDIVNLIKAKMSITQNYSQEANIKVYRGKKKAKKAGTNSPLSEGLIKIT